MKNDNKGKKCKRKIWLKNHKILSKKRRNKIQKEMKKSRKQVLTKKHN